jgi:hypothetical protein
VIFLGRFASSSQLLSTSDIMVIHASDAPMIDHRTPILDNVDSVLRQAPCCFRMPDSELEPRRARSLRQDVVHMGWHIGRSAEHNHNVEIAGYVSDVAVHTLTEDRVDMRVVHRNGHDLYSRSLQIGCDVMGRRAAPGFGLDTQHRYTLCSAQYTESAFIVVY